MKKCSSCEQFKQIEDFHKSKRSKDGLLASCKKCRSELGKKRWQRVKHLLTGDMRHLRRRSSLEVRRAQARRWASRNRGKLSAAVARYQKKHPARVYAHSAAYEARKLLAMPKWANSFFIAEAYDLAARRTKLLGFPWHVDHIVPLKSHLVCGLHVEHNLRVIPASENVRKNNRWWPDMP